MSDIKNNHHWVDENYRQRITTAQWKEMLMEHQDTMIFKGKLRKLKGKKLGSGVVEIYKVAIRSK